jgi:hypothetical protein
MVGIEGEIQPKQIATDDLLKSTVGRMHFIACALWRWSTVIRYIFAALLLHF